MNIKIIPIIWLIMMFIIESIKPKRKWQIARIKRVLFHVGLSIINGIIAGVIGYLFLNYMRDNIYNSNWGILNLLGIKGLSGIIMTLIVLDMFDYWWHRFNHVVPFLWRFHKVHHVDTHVDTMTSLRFHPGEILISALFAKMIWLILLGPTFIAFIIFETAISMASQFHHSNIDFSDRVEKRIRKIIVTPRFHASHHTVTVRTCNANYSTIFIFWDKIFGTYREPDYKEMERLGLAGGRDSYLSLAATFKGPFTKEY